MKPTSTLYGVDATITYDPSKFDTLHCVYLHHATYDDGQKRLMYVGYCKLTDVFYCPDARRNSAWQKYVAPLKNVEACILFVCENEFEARSAAAKLSREQQPYCNIHGKPSGNGGAIRCLQTGQIFENASQAATQLAIAQSALSNHLNRRKGYNAVKGYTFEKVTEDGV